MSSPRTAELAADPRVRRGMEAQLALRRERLSAGDEPLGWKVGFGTAAAFEKLGTSAPLVGFLLRSALVVAGAAYSLDGFSGAALEPEVAVRVGEGDVPDALGPAFEIVDVEPTSDVERILAGDIFQRAVVLGPMKDRRSLGGASALVTVNGEASRVDDPEALPGPLSDLLTHVADLLPEFGERLRPGDVVITGSIVPPLEVAPGDEVEYELEGFCSIAISFTS
jgi:2-keto-4-pentenoate hydratase